MSSEIPQYSESKILKRLLTGSALSIVRMVITIVVGLFMTPFLLEHIGTRQMGIWILVGSFTGFYGLLDFGITSAMSRYMTLYFSQKDVPACNSFASIGFLIFTCMGIVAALIAFLIAGISLFVYRDTVDDINIIAWVTVILGINFMFNFPLRVFSGIITGCLRQDLDNLRSLFFYIIGAVLTITIVYSGGKIIAMALSNLVLGIINVFYFYRISKYVFPQLCLSRESVRKKDIKPLFKYGFFTSLASITDTLRFRISSIIIAGFLSVEIITHYGIATTLVSNFQQLMGNCTMWLTNWFTRLDAKNDKAAIRNHMMFAYKMTITLATFIAFGLIFWSIPFIDRWVGWEFLDVYDSLVLLTLGMMFAMWQSPATRVLYATANHHYYSAVNAIDAVLNIAVTLLLVPRYGMVGVAIGNCTAMFISKIFILPQVIIRILNITNMEYWGNLSKTLAKCMICLIVPFMVSKRLVVSEYKWLFLNGIICAMIYFSCTLFLVLSKEERQNLCSRILKKESIQT